MTSALCHHGIENDHGLESIANAANRERPLGRLVAGLGIAALIATLAWSAIYDTTTLAPVNGVASGIENHLDGRGKWSGYGE